MTAFSNSRRNPLSPTAISWRVMDLEVHDIEEFNELPGIYGIELQDRPNPNVTNVYFTDTGWMTGDGVTGLTQMTQITTGNPAPGQFRIGGGLSSKLIMNAADDLKQVVVEYEGGGTTFSLQTIIAIVQDLIGTITDTFNRVFLNFIRARTSSGVVIENNTAGTIATFGASGGTGVSVAGGLSVGGVVSIPDGTAALPGLAFTSDPDTGLYRPGANQIGFATGGAERFRIEETGQLKAVYESTVGTDYNTTLHNGYLCRAWVNFNGTGTVAIRASGNVSSITDNGTGDYTVNFTTAMPDADYACTFGAQNPLDTNLLYNTFVGIHPGFAPTVSSVRVRTTDTVNQASANVEVSNSDTLIVNMAVFR